MSARGLIRLAWRNLWRHTQRTLLMIAIVAFGSFVIVVFWGLVDGWIASMTEAQVSLDQGSIQVFAAGYRADPTPQNGLSPDALAAVMTAVNGLAEAHASPRLVVYGMLQSAYGSTGMQIRGIDTAREPEVTTLNRHLVDGRFLQGSGEILLSRHTAETLDVRLGERVVVLVQGKDGPTSRPFTAVGLYASGLSGLDDSTVFVPIADARAMTGSDGATSVALRLPKGHDASAKAELERRLGSEFDVETHLDLNPLLRDMIRISVIEMTPMILILALLAGFGVANTVLFSVIERTHEFGIMMAVGMNVRRLSQMVLSESLLVSLMGFLVGGGAGYLVILYLARYGWNLGSTLSQMTGPIGMPTVIYASTSGWYWLGSLSVVIVTGLVAAWYPARRVAALQPAAAIREG
jgi:ABC-type lipoprotein release transport system permease subunit